MLIAKGMAPWGAVALRGIDVVTQRLYARIHEPRAWWEERGAMAEQAERVADQAAAEGRDPAAGNNYLRAGNYCCLRKMRNWRSQIRLDKQNPYSYSLRGMHIHAR